MSKGNKAGEIFPKKLIRVFNVNQRCLKKIVFSPKLENFFYRLF